MFVLFFSLQVVKLIKGIRKTIIEEPHMFLAFNNGIAATAEEMKIKDLQMVRQQ